MAVGRLCLIVDSMCALLLAEVQGSLFMLPLKIMTVVSWGTLRYSRWDLNQLLTNCSDTFLSSSSAKNLPQIFDSVVCSDLRFSRYVPWCCCFDLRKSHSSTLTMFLESWRRSDSVPEAQFFSILEWFHWCSSVHVYFLFWRVWMLEWVPWCSSDRGLFLFLFHSGTPGCSSVQSSCSSVYVLMFLSSLILECLLNLLEWTLSCLSDFLKHLSKQLVHWIFNLI